MRFELFKICTSDLGLSERPLKRSKQLQSNCSINVLHACPLVSDKLRVEDFRSAVTFVGHQKFIKNESFYQIKMSFEIARI